MRLVWTAALSERYEGQFEPCAVWVCRALAGFAVEMMTCIEEPLLRLAGRSRSSTHHAQTCVQRIL